MNASFPENVSPNELLYPDLDQELATTRRMIAAVPDGKNDWTPHKKSMTLGRLATHLAELPGFATSILSSKGLDWATFTYVPEVADTAAQRLALFDRKAGELKEAIARADWTTLGERWVMRNGDQIILDEQKGKLLRSFGLSHMGHHRAQLGVFLRLLDHPIPGSYGPSADES